MQETQPCMHEFKAAKEALEGTVFFGKDARDAAGSHVLLKDYRCPRLESSLGKDLFADTAAAWIGRSIDCNGEYIRGVWHIDGMGQVATSAFRRLGVAATHKIHRVHDDISFNHGDGPGRKAWTQRGVSDLMAAEFLFRLSHGQICESVLLAACPHLQHRDLNVNTEGELGKSPRTLWTPDTAQSETAKLGQSWDKSCKGEYCDFDAMMQLFQTHYWYARALQPVPYPKGLEPGHLNVAVHVRLGDRTEWADMNVPKHNFERYMQFMQNVLLPSVAELDAENTPVTLHVFTETPRVSSYEVDGAEKVVKQLASLVRLPESVSVKWHVDEDDFVSWHAFATADISLVQPSSSFGTTAMQFLPSEASPIAFGGAPRTRVRCARSCFDPWSLEESQQAKACLKKCFSVAEQSEDTYTRREL
eukprot:TRINITY_DN57296_c0_g1_i1.p1 TRINITY_DN57296_c0_g1~~TRINITY_DN57296_c0_g1_i1.p1  ORF type:complete len:481 (+),score=53.00 TRINITY_DN57296_c0_g1_i1:190-1443(+)